MIQTMLLTPVILGHVPSSGRRKVMFIKNCGAVLVLGVILAVVCGNADAQQKVYKWVDEEGVIHFGDEPPKESTEADIDVFTTDPAPPYVPPAQTTVKSPSASEADVAKQSTKPEAQTPPPVKKMAITKMSLADLDRRCEAARDKIIAPLKKAEIEKCIQTETGDQGWCETFWADYGDAQRTRSGVFIPRQFNDIPECVEAQDERNRRVL
jgi:hypothetical protein